LTKGSDGSVVTVKRESGKDVMVEELGLRDGSTVFVKDLGTKYISINSIFCPAPHPHSHPSALRTVAHMAFLMLFL